MELCNSSVQVAHWYKESACQCSRHGFDPWVGKIPHASGQLSLCATATEAHMPLNPCSATRETTAMRSLHCNAEVGLFPESETSPGGAYGNPLRYSCLENLHGQRSLAGYSPRGHKESYKTEWLSTAQTVDSFRQLFAECLQCGIP